MKSEYRGGTSCILGLEQYLGALGEVKAKPTSQSQLLPHFVTPHGKMPYPLRQLTGYEKGRWAFTQECSRNQQPPITGPVNEIKHAYKMPESGLWSVLQTSWIFNIHLMSLETWSSYWVKETRENNLPRWFSGKESTCKASDLGLIIGSGRSPGGGNANPLQYSCLGKPMDRETWEATDHGVAKCWTWLQLKNRTTMENVWLQSSLAGMGRKESKIKLHSLFIRKVWPFRSCQIPVHPTTTEKEWRGHLPAQWTWGSDTSEFSHLLKTKYKCYMRPSLSMLLASPWLHPLPCA